MPSPRLLLPGLALAAGSRLEIGAAPEGFLALRLAETAAASGRQGLIHAARSEPQAELLAVAVQDMAPALQVILLPPWDCLPYDRISPSRRVMGRRIAALQALARPAPATGRLVLTTVEALLQRLPAGREGATEPVPEADLRRGDIVVHSEHGVARLDGIEAVESDGLAADFLNLAYAREKRLMVPAEDSHLLWRYGAADTPVALDELGGEGCEAQSGHVRLIGHRDGPRRVRRSADAAAGAEHRRPGPLRPRGGSADRAPPLARTGRGAGCASGAGGGARRPARPAARGGAVPPAPRWSEGRLLCDRATDAAIDRLRLVEDCLDRFEGLVD